MSQIAGAFYNTENTTGFSGLSKSFPVGFASQKGFATAQSGAQTITTGAGVLFNVIGLTGFLSGATGGVTSQSGCSITVYDAVSGTIIAFQSGPFNYGSNTAGILYQFNYGTASGILTTGTGLPLAPPDLTGINTVFRSGLVACVSGGVVGTVGIALSYSAGV
jgi:hypothetical protein